MVVSLFTVAELASLGTGRTEVEDTVVEVGDAFATLMLELMLELGWVSSSLLGGTEALGSVFIEEAGLESAYKLGDGIEDEEGGDNSPRA